MGDFFDNDSLRGPNRGLSAANSGLGVKLDSISTSDTTEVASGGSVSREGDTTTTTWYNKKTETSNVDFKGSIASGSEKASELGSSLASVVPKSMGDAANKLGLPGGAASALGGAASALGGAASALGGVNVPGLPQLPFSAKNPDATPLTDNVGWQPNVLSGLQNQTYHIRLFIADDQPFALTSFSTYSSLYDYVTKTKKTTTIAESGVTGLNIVSMEIDSVMSPNAITRSTKATKITMKIFEPGGVALLDIMADAAKELQIKDYSKVPYYVEVRFMGYDERGAFMINPCTSFNNKGVWVYQVILNDIEVAVDESGSQYSLTMLVADSQIASSDSVIIPTQIAPSGATVGEMVKDLNEKLTKSFENLYGYEYHTFKEVIPTFTFDGKTYDPSTFKVSPIDSELSDRKNMKLEVMDGSVRGQFSAGARLNDIFEMILANSEEVQQLAKGIMKQHELDGYGNKFRECLVFRTYFASEIRKFDTITKSYLMDYTVTLHPYFTELPILSKQQIEISSDPGVQISNARKLREAGFLVKKYDYLYSGLNTEVLEFDINYKANWVALLPKAVGMSYSNEANAPQDLVNKKDQLKQHENAVKKNQEILTERNDAMVQIQRLEDKGDLDAETTKQIETQRKRISDIDLDAIKKETAGHLAAIEQLTAAETATNKLKLDQRPASKYAEDVHEAASSTPQSAVLPISTAQAAHDTRFWPNGGFPDQHHRDRAILGAVFDQIYGNTGASLQSVEMKIKGDPYWLGSGGLQNTWTTLVTRQIDVMTRGESKWQDFNKGDSLLVVYFRYPRGKDGTGAPVIKAQDFFTGVYMVKKVKNLFLDGKFEQTLSCIRAPLIEVQKAFGAVDDKSQAAVNPAGAGRGSINPPMAIPGAEGMLESASKAVDTAKSTAMSAMDLANSSIGTLTQAAKDAASTVVKRIE